MGRGDTPLPHFPKFVSRVRKSGILDQNASTPWYLAQGPSSCREKSLQPIQSRNLYQAPASGRNHGFPLYSPSGAPGKGIPANGFSTSRPPVVISAILLPR